ncbi:ubiquitin carboxyl-terminal hydrolase 2 [Stemphylium lycopersici]|uniref:ubiquitinyl hydrolase 1 n=1 Tax=Stemphylium lycopersici TaxID=183478 RepID=A0A364MZ05_STELY|nr:ubiquitin carboxyl-terminal hydrolase 2 [Stemphylium lycopersici]
MTPQIDSQIRACSHLKDGIQEQVQEQAVSSNGPANPAYVDGPGIAKDNNGTPIPHGASDIASSMNPSKATPLNTRKRCPPEPFSDSEPSSKRSKDSPSPCAPKNDVTTKPVFPSPLDMPATAFDKKTWQGFCDIESEPACFSVILREMGVQDVTVREVFSMDQDFIRENVPQPIYGFILLFHYREFGNDDQADQCPKNVWFANQLPAQNSCATLAMVNILMNQSTEVDIGEHLKQFKEFTNDFPPYQRGEAFASFDFVKRIHNSFAKKMDILEGDKHLNYKVKRAERLKAQATEKTTPSKKGTKSRRGSATSAATEDSADSVEENAHHYIAFVPVGNQVWKLDGLDKQPTCVGAFSPENGETWLDSVSETIAALMATGDDDYGVIALTQSPLLSLRKSASLTINTLSHVESRLDQLSVSPLQDWRHLVSADEQPPSPRILCLEQHLAANPVPDALKAIVDSEDTTQLLARRRQLIVQANDAGANIMMEVQNEAEEDIKATQRRYDSGPVIKKWLEMLAQNGFLEENLDRFMPSKSSKK